MGAALKPRHSHGLARKTNRHTVSVAIAQQQPRQPPQSASLAAYGVIVAAGVLLWWLDRFRAASVPSWAPYDFDWTYYVAAALGVWWYLRGLSLTPTAERPSRWRIAAYFLGVALIWTVLQTHFEYMAQHMFFLNRAQHVVMHHLGPFLIALAWPGATLARGMPDRLERWMAARPVLMVRDVVQQPLLAAVLFVGLIALWLWPSVHIQAMLDPGLYRFMNWTMVGDGILFWFLVLDPRACPPSHASHGARMATSLLVMFPQIVIGAMIAFAGTDIYGFYDWCGRLYPSIGAVDDQTYGGLIVWIPAAMMSIVGMLLALNTLRLNEDQTAPQETEDEEEGVVISSATWTGN